MESLEVTDEYVKLLKSDYMKRYRAEKVDKQKESERKLRYYYQNRESILQKARVKRQQQKQFEKDLLEYQLNQ